MAPSSETQNAWVERVLGVTRKSATSAPGNATERWRAARGAWGDAIEAVDGQIEKLAQALRATGQPILKEIADVGLNGVTKNHKVPLMAALMEIGGGAPESLAKSGRKALALAQAFRQHIETDARIAACDNNPLNIAVSIRGTLGPALAGLERTLADITTH